MNVENMINAELLMLVGGIAAFLLTIYWVLRHELRDKYAIGWLVIACAFLILGIFPSILKEFARLAHLSFSAGTLFIAMGVIYIFAFSVSVSLSRAHRRNLRLTQELGLLEQRLRELEEKHK